MKTELWSKVKRGDYLIYANLDDGVQKAKVTEIDITIEVFEPEYKKEQPYGLTAETGIVKIKVGEIELVENLANLIRFNLRYYRDLRQAWSTWQLAKIETEAYKEAFIKERAELKEK